VFDEIVCSGEKPGSSLPLAQVSLSTAYAVPARHQEWDTEADGRYQTPASGISRTQ